MNTITAAQVMTSKLLTVGPDWPIERLMEFLTNHAISGAPVVEKDEPIGVVSLTDIARHGTLTDKSGSETPSYYRQSLEHLVAREEMPRFHMEPESRTTVRDIMTPVVFAVDEDATVQEVAEMMITGRIHRVFVRRTGRLTGVISSMDLLPLVRDM